LSAHRRNIWIKHKGDESPYNKNYPFPQGLLHTCITAEQIEMADKSSWSFSVCVEVAVKCFRDRTELFSYGAINIELEEV
jgi:hypothetical protein